MNIRNVGHSMKYEAECVAMLFFPDEKIVTAQYEAGAVLPQDEDFIENRLEDGVMKVTLFLNGELSSMSQPVLPVANSPYEEAEFIMCDMTVSYTHLDVYKRQVRPFFPGVRAGDRA